MITETGIWTREESDKHIFSYRLWQWIGRYLPRHEPVIDLGCGLATGLRYLHDIGFSDLTGVEGSENDYELGNVVIADLTKPLELGKMGNLVCVEVFEHIPREHENALLNNITRHCKGKLILSVAGVGQEGTGHVNCRDNGEVIGLMNARGFRYLHDDTQAARSVAEGFVAYLKTNILIFER